MADEAFVSPVVPTGACSTAWIQGAIRELKRNITRLRVCGPRDKGPRRPLDVGIPMSRRVVWSGLGEKLLAKRRSRRNYFGMTQIVTCPDSPTKHSYRQAPRRGVCKGTPRKGRYPQGESYPL